MRDIVKALPLWIGALNIVNNSGGQPGQEPGWSYNPQIGHQPVINREFQEWERQ